MSKIETDFSAAQPNTGRVMMLEFNELCPHLLDRFIGEGMLPNFKALRDASDRFVTRPDVDDPLLLEPWIQWYSVHTGRPYDDHRVFHLTDGKRAGHDDVFRMLMAAGHTVASLHSMNVAPFASAGSTFLGDPWSAEDDSFPPQLDAFNRFVGAQVREHSNAGAGLSRADTARFLAFMAANGLSIGTLAAIARQLAAEQRSAVPLGWQRIAILDALLGDVVCAHYARTRPDFCTVFSNSVAHLQHAYWRYHEPEAFPLKPSDRDMAAYGDAIAFGYRVQDRLLGRLLPLARKHGARVILASALSQQPFVRCDASGGQHFWRLREPDVFLARLGIACASNTPTMTHQYMMRFADKASASAARARLEALRLEDGRQVFGFPAIESDGPALYYGCQIAAADMAEARLIDAATGTTHSFGDAFYMIDGMKSGRHHPDGVLWIAGGEGRMHETPVSILDILPTQLEMMGAAPPLGLAGRSLAPMLAGARVSA